MTKDTVRDEVWKTAITLAGDRFAAPEAVAEGDLENEMTREAYTGVGVTKATVCERAEAGDRTVHDVLKTMVEYGLLGSTTRRLPHAVRGDQRRDGQTRQDTAVYYPAGDLADTPVEEGGLIGYSPIETDGAAGEEAVAAARDSLSL